MMTRFVDDASDAAMMMHLWVLLCFLPRRGPVFFAA
jgi:hypothetical protein